MHLRLSRPCLALLRGGPQTKCGFVCVHSTRWLLVALDGSETENLIVGGFLQCILQSPQYADNFGTSAIPPVFPLLSLGHSLGAFPAPGGASMFCFVRHGERPSGLGFQQQIFCAKNTLEISCRSLRRKHISALGAGHPRVASRKSVPSEIRAKPTWRKSLWHSTKTPSA